MMAHVDVIIVALTAIYKGLNTMTKQEWLEESIFVDTYGRPYNLSDVPMTMMPRKEAFDKRNSTTGEISSGLAILSNFFVELI